MSHDSWRRKRLLEFITPYATFVGCTSPVVVMVLAAGLYEVIASTTGKALTSRVA